MTLAGTVITACLAVVGARVLAGLPVVGAGVPAVFGILGAGVAVTLTAVGAGVPVDCEVDVTSFWSLVAMAPIASAAKQTKLVSAEIFMVFEG